MTMKKVTLSKCNASRALPKCIFAGVLSTLAFVSMPAPSAAQDDPSFDSEPAVDAKAPPSPRNEGKEQAPRDERMKRRQERRLERQDDHGDKPSWGREDRGEHGGRGERGHRGGPEKAGKFAFINEYIGAVQDPYKATGMAVMGIKHYYKRSGDVSKAVPEIEQQLAQTKDPKMRNILLFALRQIYEESQNDEKFLEINRKILKENTEAR